MRVTRYCSASSVWPLRPIKSPLLSERISRMVSSLLASLKVSTAALIPIKPRISTRVALPFSAMADASASVTGGSISPLIACGSSGWSPAGKPVAPSSPLVGRNPERELPAKAGFRVERSTLDFVRDARMRAFCAPKPKIPFLPSDRISTVIFSRATPSAVSAFSMA